MSRIRKAHEFEARTLSRLAERSKAYWGYSPELMLTWRLQGTFFITPEMCRQNIQVIEEGESTTPRGFYQLVHHPPEAHLEDLWIDPEYIASGRRLGEKLLQHALHASREADRVALMLHAEPQAVGFYEHYGLGVVGSTLPDPLTGRKLPIMRIELEV